MDKEFNEELLIKEVRKIGVKLAEISSEVNNYFSKKVTPEIYKKIQDLLAKHTLTNDFNKFLAENKVSLDSEVVDILKAFFDDIKFKPGTIQEVFTEKNFQDFLKGYCLGKELNKFIKRNNLDLETANEIKRKLKLME